MDKQSLFSFGKSKNRAERSVESETIQRWRRSSASASGNAAPALKTEDYPDDSYSIDSEEPFELGNLETADWAAGSALNSESSAERELPRIVRNEDRELEAAISILRPAAGSMLPADPALSAEEDLERRFGGEIKSALGPGTVIEGKFRFDAPVRIDGTMSGEICSTSALIVGEHAVVDGAIQVGTLIVFGRVTGTISAEELVEIKAGGELLGDITTDRIAIEDGAFFQGCCNTAEPA